MLQFLSFFTGRRFGVYEGEGQDKRLQGRSDLERTFATLNNPAKGSSLTRDPNLALRESHAAAREGYERYQSDIIKPRKS